MRFLIICIVLLIELNPLKAQNNEYFFCDTTKKEGGSVLDHLQYGNTIIVAGYTFDKSKFTPAILRIDTAGNVLWNTTIKDTSLNSGYSARVSKIILGNDGFIYAICDSKIWKVDPVNGTIILKKDLSGNLYPKYVIDYDSTKFIITYNVSYDGQFYTDKFAFVSKTTCDTLSSFSIGKIPWQNYLYNFCIDNKKNIYYSKFDTIFKVSGNNPKDLLWKKVYPSVKISQSQFLFIDSLTKMLFVLGQNIYGSGIIVKINSDNGVLISNSSTRNNSITDYQISNGNLFITWSSNSLENEQHFYATKYNLISADIIWDINYVFKGYRSIPFPCNDLNIGFANSLAIDSNGDVYLTGNYGNANVACKSGNSNWGILKLNGNDGSLIYEQTITADSSEYDNTSIGKAVYVINNMLIFVGELETYTGFWNNYYNSKSYLTFVKLEPSSGGTLYKQFHGGYYQFPSKTLQIVKVSDKKTIIMKQKGRSVILEMYDFKNKLLWEKPFNSNFYLMGGNMDISDNEDIWFYATTKRESNSFPFYERYLNDRIWVFHLNSSGVILNEYSFDCNSSDLRAVEIHADDSGAFIFYYYNEWTYNKLLYRRMTFSNISEQYTSDIDYHFTNFDTKYCYNNKKNKALLFGNINNKGLTKVVEIDKNTLATTNLAYLPNSVYLVNYVFELDTNRIFLCAKDKWNAESIGLYNISLKDTVWSRQLSSTTNTYIIKGITGPEKKYIYLMCKNETDVVIRKLETSNGKLLWSHTFNNQSSQSTIPTDISFDSFQNQILISGYGLTNSKNNRPFILILDTNEKAFDTINLIPDFPGDNSAYCCNVLPDGTKWIGGSINKNQFGQTGFIYELTNPNNSIPSFPCDSKNIMINIYPNPFSASATISIKSELSSKYYELKIFNIFGQLVRQIKLSKGKEYILDRNGLLSGTYIFQFYSNNSFLSSGKIIIID